MDILESGGKNRSCKNLYRVAISSSATDEEKEIIRRYWDMRSSVHFFTFEEKVKSLCLSLKLKQGELLEIIKDNSYAYCLRCAECGQAVEKYFNRTALVDFLEKPHNKRICDECRRSVNLTDRKFDFVEYEIVDTLDKHEEKDFAPCYGDRMLDIEI